MPIKIRQYRTEDEDQVVQLWITCGLVVPWNDPQGDILRKLTVQPELFLVGCLMNKIVATAMAGYEGHRGWINYLAVHPDQQHAGLGERMMEEAETRLSAAGCPKINLQVRSSNSKMIEFYKKIGYKVEDVISLGKRLETDE